MPITKLEPKNAGCWVAGHWGQYAVAHAIQIAGTMGYDDKRVLDLAHRHLLTMGPNVNAHPLLTEDEYDELYWASDKVDEWLNENVAPEGYTFGWFDGEFFLWTHEEWEQV